MHIMLCFLVKQEKKMVKNIDTLSHFWPVNRESEQIHKQNSYPFRRRWQKAVWEIGKFLTTGGKDVSLYTF